MPVDKFGRMSDTKTKDTGVSLTYINNNYIRSDGTTPVSGSINMNGNTLYNVPDPVNPQDVATKEYADQVGGGSPFLKEIGNYQSTNKINMAFKKLLNLPAPTEPFEATTKDYVDTSINDVVDKVMKQRTHLIVAHASYQGDLIKGDYQFTFGGNNVKTSKYREFNGFLMLHSGSIKRFVLKDTGLKFYTDTIGDDDFFPAANSIIPLFTLVLVRPISGYSSYIFEYEKENIYIDLGIINLKYPDIGGFESVYFFTSNLPDGLEKYKFNANDILNIRTEYDTTPKQTDLYLHHNKITKNIDDHYKDKKDDVFFSYLATILIELDPL